MAFEESQVIGILAEIFATDDPALILGIGDDAAVVATQPRSVVTTDMAVEGTHFNTAWSSAFDIGRKITAANLADIYAMGASPQFLVVAMTLSGNESMEWIRELAQGIAHEARSCGASVVGGDLTQGAIKVIAMTAVGAVERHITRSGAGIGDAIYVSGLPGWSAAGLALISNENFDDLEGYAIDQFCAPSVDYSAGAWLASSGATAMCDISDALIIQSEQMAQASGVRFEFDVQLFTHHPEFAALKELAEKHSVDVWQWIFAGGEDHVFLATGKDLLGLHVGTVTEGKGVAGLEMKKAPDTWRHFN